jgi:hypothetical protein
MLSEQVMNLPCSADLRDAALKRVSKALVDAGSTA